VHGIPFLIPLQKAALPEVFSPLQNLPAPSHTANICRIRRLPTLTERLCEMADSEEAEERKRRQFSLRIKGWYRRVRSRPCIPPTRSSRSLSTDKVVLPRPGLCAGSCVFCFLPWLWHAWQPVQMIGRHTPVPPNLAYHLQSRISTGICVLTWLVFRWGEAMSPAQTTGFNFS
jgi:hypothetical protein